MWSTDRNTMRAVFYDAWRHFKEQTPLTGVEALIVEALVAHPEYQPLFDDGRPSETIDPTAGSGTNPFLHLGLHIAIAEQIATDRPPGVASEWQRLQGLWQDAHRARHAMMECLEETLWEAQSRGIAPDDSAYIERLRALGTGGRKK
ncbi:MAG: DUF1841 family protein [Acidiferrobacter sp.]